MNPSNLKKHKGNLKKLKKIKFRVRHPSVELKEKNQKQWQKLNLEKEAFS